MAVGTDLYTILRLYANKNKTPQVSVASFLPFLEKYAKHYEAERPDLAYWAQDTGRKVWAELSKLSSDNKIELITDETGTVISIHQFYIDLIQQAYKNIDESAELPFPDEAQLGIVIPANQVRSINIEFDLPNMIPQNAQENPPILKLVFPDNGGSALILPTMIQKRLLEISLLKVRHYLRSHNNKEYIQHKLAPAFQGKEAQLRDTLNQLLVRPFDAIRDMEASGDFIYPFWAYLCTQVKGDIKKKNDRLPEDMAALQAVLVIEVYNNFFKGKVTREKEAETAFRNLELQLEKSPYFYTIDDIIRFTDTKGIPLLGQYTQEALEQFIKEKTTTATKDKLPDLLIIQGQAGEKWFIKKNRMLVLCFKLLGEVRPKVKTAISQRWFRLMQNYDSEPAMQDEEAFEQELWELTGRVSPPLVSLLDDKKLYLVYEELEKAENGIPENTRLFYKGALVPLSELLLLQQKDLLTDVKVLLPFWYSLPFISPIIAFFKRQSRKKKKLTKTTSAVQRPQAPNDSSVDKNNSPTEIKKQDRRAELREAAQKARSRLIPEGHTLDSYMEDLLDRWNRIINVDAKNNLTEDVNALIRDYLRRTIRSLKNAPFTADRISNLAETLVNTPNLQKLPAQESLKLYIQLYIIKLLSD